MDGTLLDSEKIWDIALADLATRLGGTLSPAARASMVGSNLTRSLSILHEDLGVAGDESDGDYLMTRAGELFRTSLEWKPGARKLLEAVRDAGLPAALVTSTIRWLTEIALDTLGREYFATTVCGDEVSPSKPDPAPYRAAARLVGAEPVRCVAVEDSPLGVRSARAAGCAVLAVPSEVELHPQDGVTIVDSLVGVSVADLAALLPG